MTTTQPNKHSTSRNELFVEHVRRISADAGNRARLRRSLRNGKVIGDDAWWLLGGWLPADLDEALIMARVAAWCAAHHQTASAPWRTPAGELARAGAKFSDQAAQRSLEGMTADGIETYVRIDRVNRVIEMLRPVPVRIDWALLIADLSAFSRGGDRAHRARHCWYRDFHRSDPDNNESSERESNHDQDR
ncbi:MAG: type I-E CRISPR-associated protein Cse2/CasB [Acidimicrobiales bacterium]|nr:type I-E CRISPR-associated protein Cse2/CasB [Acidimicrobiales bacterium]MYA38870.1 type I-E CRISPR-associated protein Cse2/CasB [Acidimicrobiia bacterium]MYB82806.1 type I-E CRISPR-associated protein Cse2/CasB [Acidimicrobiales bacterium]MYI12087.1 type I-E CRISPR-associated protein Cse2/CasB [Acidimicrobiales bacterium]MYK55307.1 type I-E CRISPR-associated protein Cse2/CasB [Acidimicrobiia bacterium]